MRYRYLVDLRRGISVFAIFSYGIAVLGTPQCPPPQGLLCEYALQVLALLHAYSYTTIDTDKVVQEFCTRKPRSLAFEF